MELKTRCCFCTVITENHLYKALALFSSLNYRIELDLHVLFIGVSVDLQKEYSDVFPSIVFHALENVCSVGDLQKLTSKYGRTSDETRWTAKSAFMLYLLEKSNYMKVIYCDSDIFFHSDPSFLLDLLDYNSLLLTPHWRPLTPQKDPVQYHCNFTDGLYNGGFVAAGQGAKDALRWWLSACLHACIKDLAKGFYDDQRYLDLLPVYFDGVHVIMHSGCNVAEWNIEYNTREEINGEVVIKGGFPIVFIHYTDLTIKYIENGRDPLLRSHLENYRKCLEMSLSTVQKFLQRETSSLP